jgi:hypothetical protein
MVSGLQVDYLGSSPSNLAIVVLELKILGHLETNVVAHDGKCFWVATVWMIGVRWFHSQRGGCEFFSSPPRPDLLWGTPNFLSSGYRRLFLWGGGDVAGVK